MLYLSRASIASEKRHILDERKTHSGDGRRVAIGDTVVIVFSRLNNDCMYGVSP